MLLNVEINDCRIELVQGDISEQEVDAIVNAANKRLFADDAIGYGVNGAIHRRGGEAIWRETYEKYPEGCPAGSAVVSGAGNLKAKFVFHAVGPIWIAEDRSGEDPNLIDSACQACIELAVEHKCRSIVFPAIGTGVYGYPVKMSALMSIGRVVNTLCDNPEWFRNHPDVLRLVRFCLSSEDDLKVFSETLADEINRPS